MGRQPQGEPRRSASRGSSPRHPYRDTAILHAALGSVILLVAWLTGGDLAKSAVVAGIYVVVAVGWSWYRFRQRLRRGSKPGAATDAGK